MYYSSLISSTVGVGVTGLSYTDLYSDLSVYASFAKSFTLANSRKASAGIRLRYETLGTTPNYPKLHFLLADIGFTLDLTPEFTLGGAALNLLGAKYEVVNGETEKLDRQFLIGVAYHPLQIPIKLLTSLEEDARRGGQALALVSERNMIPLLSSPCESAHPPIPALLPRALASATVIFHSMSVRVSIKH